MRARPLTETQEKVLQFVKSYLASNGYPPTRNEIGEAFGFKSNSAQYHLQALHRKGAITLVSHVQRGIKCLV